MRTLILKAVCCITALLLLIFTFLLNIYSATMPSSTGPATFGDLVRMQSAREHFELTSAGVRGTNRLEKASQNGDSSLHNER